LPGKCAAPGQRLLPFPFASNIAHFIPLGKPLHAPSLFRSPTDKSAQRGQKNTAGPHENFPTKINVTQKKSRWRWQLQLFSAAGQAGFGGMVFYLLIARKLFEAGSRFEPSMH